MRPDGSLATCKTPSGIGSTSSLQIVRQMTYQYDQFLNPSVQQKRYYRRDLASGLPDCTSGAPVMMSATEEFAFDELQRLVGSTRRWTDDAATGGDSYSLR